MDVKFTLFKAFWGFGQLKGRGKNHFKQPNTFVGKPFFAFFLPLFKPGMNPFQILSGIGKRLDTVNSSSKQPLV